MPDAVVIKVEKKAEKNALIHFDIGQVAWSPDFEVASKLLIGKPLPADWTMKTGEFGPQAFPPRPKGPAPQAAWRNTKEGFLAEAEGRLRWQQVEEERRDRRTALMQAVAALPPLDVEALATAATYEIRNADNESGPMLSLFLAEQFYRWLRETSGAPSSASASLPVSSAGGAPEPTSGTGAGEAGTATEGYGEGPDVAVPSTDELATADDLANAAKHGLTPTKAKALAKGLGFEWPPTREQLVAVIERYLEVKK